MIRVMRLCMLVLLLVAAGIPVRAQNAVTLHDDEICQGESKTLSTLVNGSFHTFHSWSANGQVITSTNYNISVNPTATTIYTLDYTDNAGTRQQKSLRLTVYQTPDFTIPADQTICSGSAVQLTATVRNGDNNTIIGWLCNDGNTYTNNYSATNATSTTDTYVYTANVRNHVNCPVVTKSFSVTVHITPTSAAINVIGNDVQCQGVPFDLDNLISFDVVDIYGNREKGGKICGGKVTWYTTPGGGTPVGPVVTVNSPAGQTFYADYNNVQICYTNECLSFSGSFYGESRRNVTVRARLSEFSLSDNMPCRGESLIADYVLLDMDDLQPSYCDTIADLTLTNGPRPHSIRKINNGYWQVEYSPLLDNDDTIKVLLTAKSGVSATYSHAMRRPDDPKPDSARVVCKGEDITFFITSYRCDKINSITFTGLENYTVDKIPEPQEFRYRIVVHNVLDDVLNVGYTVNFYSDYDEKNTTATGTYTLRIHNDKPTSMVVVNNGYAYFAEPNLCLGDSLTYSFTPPVCDFLTGSTWTCTNAPLTAQQTASSTHLHRYVVKPTGAGTYNIEVKVNHRRPTDLSDSTYVFSFPINVIDRPKMFMNGQDRDTTAFCFDQGGQIDLSTNNVINYNYVESGSVLFVDEFPPSSVISPFTTGDFNVQVTYKQQCSEMISIMGYGVLRVISDRSSISDIISAAPSCCVTNGINITSTEAEGTELKWEHNGQEISFPYMVDPGIYLLRVTVKNSCIPTGSVDSKVVNVEDHPKVEAMPDTSVCKGAVVVLYTLPGSIGDLVWDSPLQLPIVVIEETSTFTVTASNTCGSTTDQATIHRTPDALAQTRGDTSVCYNDIIPLNVTGHIGTYTWYNANDPYTALTGNPPRVQIKKDEIFRVVAVNECSSHFAYLNVQSIALPFVEVVEDSSVCYGVPFKPEVIRSVGDLTWQPDKVESVTGPVTIIVTATVAQCGSHKDTLHLDAYPALELYPVMLPNYKRLKPYTLPFETLHGEPPVHYTFRGDLPAGLMYGQTGINGAPVLGPNDYNTYHISVSAIDGHDCEVEGDYELKPEWSAATAFTPAEGNANAIFLPGYQVEIYTRNGTLIYKGDDGWSGISNGSPVHSGTYFYRAAATFDGTPKQFTGYITVMYR